MRSKFTICVSIIVVFMLFVTLFSACGSKLKDSISKIDTIKSAVEASKAYSEIDLDANLPKPDFGEIDIDTYSSFLSVDIDDISPEQYDSYISLCKEEGYTIDVKEDNDSYEAYNSEGYRISINYYSSWKQISLYLHQPVIMGNLRWPKSELADSVPKPKSKKGRIEYDSSDYIGIYVGDTSLEEFQDYIESCIDGGYKNNYQRVDYGYYAENQKGYQLTMEHIGFNTFTLELKIPEDKTEPSTEKEENDEQINITDSDNTGIRTEIKSAIDSYEEFVDYFCEFMESYDSSDSSQLSKYMELINQEMSMTDKFRSLEDEDLSNEEYYYYQEANSRCIDKLCNVSY